MAAGGFERRWLRSAKELRSLIFPGLFLTIELETVSGWAVVASVPQRLSPPDDTTL
jgi:hypothetical protein